MSNWMAVGSLVISAIALWRTFVTPALVLRTSVLREAAELRVELDALVAKIPQCVQSRERVSAAVGRGGDLERFKSEADTDSAEIESLKARLAEIEGFRGFVGYNRVEARARDATTVRVRARQLAEKYTTAMAADDTTRDFLRNAKTQRAIALQARGPGDR